MPPSIQSAWAIPGVADMRQAAAGLEAAGGATYCRSIVA